MYRLALANSDKEVIVDENIYKAYKHFKWYLDKDGYPYTLTGAKGKDRRSIVLHRIIIDCPDGFVIDHINGDKLDCRKSNVRVATLSQNAMNRKAYENGTSKYKGVYKEVIRVTRRGKTYEYEYWTAAIKVGRKVVFKKQFKDEIEAAKAYDEQALIHHKEFAVLNFPNL